jgi:hypothetical protein
MAVSAFGGSGISAIQPAGTLKIQTNQNPAPLRRTATAHSGGPLAHMVLIWYFELCFVYFKNYRYEYICNGGALPAVNFSMLIIFPFPQQWQISGS